MYAWEETKEEGFCELFVTCPTEFSWPTPFTRLGLLKNGYQIASRYLQDTALSPLGRTRLALNRRAANKKLHQAMTTPPIILTTWSKQGTKYVSASAEPDQLSSSTF